MAQQQAGRRPLGPGGIRLVLCPRGRRQPRVRGSGAYSDWPDAPGSHPARRLGDGWRPQLEHECLRVRHVVAGRPTDRRPGRRRRFAERLGCRAFPHGRIPTTPRCADGHGLRWPDRLAPAARLIGAEDRWLVCVYLATMGRRSRAGPSPAQAQHDSRRLRRCRDRCRSVEPAARDPPVARRMAIR